MSVKVTVTVQRLFKTQDGLGLYQWEDHGETDYTFPDLSWAVLLICRWHAHDNRYVYAIKDVKPAVDNALCDTF